MPIRTTCIGAFPKPEYVPIKDWFHVDIADGDYKSDVADNWSDSPEHDEQFRRATIEVIKAQLSCGITIPTDGEQRRDQSANERCASGPASRTPHRSARLWFGVSGP